MWVFSRGTSTKSDSLASTISRSLSSRMSDSLENARKFLERLQRADLSKLLAHSEVESGVAGVEDWFDTFVIVRSPRPFPEANAALPPHDRKAIAAEVL